MSEPADRQFVKEHEGLVRKLALRVRAQLDLTTDVDDLIAYGFRGLLEARERFDPTRGVLFTTFAYYRIRGAILDGVRDMAYLPRRIHAQRRAAEALDRNAEEVAAQRAATPEARADLDATLAAIDEILGKTSAAFVISVVGQSEDDGTRGTPEDKTLLQEATKRVTAALAILPERERTLIEGYYFNERTLEEMGQEMGISKSWASRLHSRALVRLREALDAA